MVRQRIRIRFSKKGDLRLISHRDLLRAIERLLRRAGLKLAMSHGFHPHPQLTFAAALALGIEGAGEVVDIGLDEEVGVDEVRQRLSRSALPGLEIQQVELLEPGRPKARARHVQYEIALPESRRSAAADALARFAAQPTLAVERKGRAVEVDLPAVVERLEIAGPSLRIRLRVVDEAQPRPRELLEALGLADLEDNGNWFTRTAIELED